MTTSTAPLWRQTLRRTKTLLALALITSTVVLLGPLPGAHAETAMTAEITEITGGTVTWGIKESWRNYIGAQGTHLSGGVTRNAAGSFDWPVTSGSFDEDTNTLKLILAGEAHFQKYPETGGGYTLDSTFKDLSVEIGPAHQVIRGTYVGKPREGGDTEILEGVDLATIDVVADAFSSTDATATWTALRTAAATTTLYPAGTRFDPVTIDYTGPGGVPDLGEHWSDQGAPVFAEDKTQRWVSPTNIGDLLVNWNEITAYPAADGSVLHVVEGHPTDPETLELRPAYVVKALDPTTLTEIATREFAVGQPTGTASAYDPATGRLFFVSQTAADNDTGYAWQVLASTWDAQAQTYGDPVEVGPSYTSQNYSAPKALLWNAAAGRLDIVAEDNALGEHALDRSVLVSHVPDGAGWSTTVRPITIERTGALAGVTTTNGYYFGSPGSSNTATWTTTLGLRDGSLISAGTDINKDGIRQPGPALWLRVTGDHSATASPIADTTEHHAARDGNGTLTAVKGTYQAVAPTADGSALLFHSDPIGSYRHVDLVNGAPKASARFEVGTDPDFVFTAASDPTRGFDYTLGNFQQKLSVLSGTETVGDLTWDQAVVKWGGGPMPLAVETDGSLIVPVRDPDHPVSLFGGSWDLPGSGLQHLQFEGVTPRVTTQPEDAAVELSPDEAKRQITFTAAVDADIAEEYGSDLQWQVKRPGATKFTDLVWATSPQLSVDASPETAGNLYRLKVTNDFGQVVSDQATLAVTYAPRVTLDTKSATVTEGSDALFVIDSIASPPHAITWQRRVSGFWQAIAENDENLVVATEGGSSSLTVPDTNTDQSGALFRAKLTNSVGTTYSDTAKLTVNPAMTIPQGGLDLEGVSLDWTGSEELQSAPPAGGSNYFSAGVSAGDQASYASTEGDVKILQVTAGGAESEASWATRAAHVGAGGHQLVQFGGGVAHLDADGSGEVNWDGAWSVNFYGGLVPFTLTDPELTVAADGVGTLTADLSGCGSSMENPGVCTPLPPVADVTVATFDGVEIDPAGKVTIDSDYAGVEIDVPADQTPQNTTVAGWGSWPQEFVDFHFDTGLSSYWYSSGGAADAKKPPQPFAVDFTDTEVVEGPELALPVITGQPVSTSALIGGDATLTVTAAGEELGYRWQKRIGSFWIDVPDETNASLKLTDVVAEDAGQYRVRVSNPAGAVTSQTATLTIAKHSTEVSITGPASTTYGLAATVTVHVPGRAGQVRLTGAGAARTTTLVGGTATFTLPARLAARSYTLSASYASDTEHAGAAASKKLTVNRADVSFTGLKVTKKPTSQKPGKARVVLRSSTGAPVTGKVTIRIKKGTSTKNVTATVKNGKATVTLPKLTKGTWRISASYPRSTNFNATSKTTTVKVTK